ncbi:hypothetical protein EV1_014916 [Malus domestica]
MSSRTRDACRPVVAAACFLSSGALNQILLPWKTDPFGEPIFAEGAGLKLADPFDYGGGLVNPNKAAYPGLIYDMDKNDYISYLCAFGYNSSTVSLLVENATSCPVPNS